MKDTIAQLWPNPTTKRPRNPDTTPIRQLYAECLEQWTRTGCARILPSGNANRVEVELLRKPGVPVGTPEEIEQIVPDHDERA